MSVTMRFVHCCVLLVSSAMAECLHNISVKVGFNLNGGDISHASCANVSLCQSRCCADPDCAGFTFTTYQPHSTAACAAGTSCCWLKAHYGPFTHKENCSSALVSQPPAPPSPYRVPTLTYVSTIANDTTGNLRDPSSVVQDPSTGRWHFYVDYMAGKTQPGWHSVLHHYSAAAIEGPYTNHGIAPGMNHSDDPTAWDYAGN